MMPNLGEMALRVNRYPWNDHSLGPIDTWSVALRSALTSCLASNAPMQLWWGTTGILLYNDAFIPWLGDAHPSALGRRAADVHGRRWQRFSDAVQHVFLEGGVIETAHHVLTPIVSGTTVEGIVCTQARVGDDHLLVEAHRVLRESLVERLDDIIDLARLSCGAPQLTLRSEGVRPLLNAAIGAVEARTGTRATIEIAVADDLTVWADGKRITHAISRLLLSTVDVRAGIMRIAAEPSGALVRITLSPVADSAPLDEAANRLIELHQGYLEHVDGQLVVSLPSARTARTTPSAQRPRRVLVIDDDHEAARVMQLTLEQLGYKVALAHDAPIALSLARVFCPDLAIVDLRLPVVDGWQLAGLLRETAGTIPLVAVTGFSEIDRSQSVAIGFAEHLQKPVGLEQLDRCISRLISPSR